MCKECGVKLSRSNGLCKKCYNRIWMRKKRKTEKTYGNRKGWTEDDLEYICKFSEVDTLSNISFGIGKRVQDVSAKLRELRKNGMYDYYIESYERKLEA